MSRLSKFAPPGAEPIYNLCVSSLLPGSGVRAMPVWLEMLLNVGGLAGFLALAARSNARGRSTGDHVGGNEP